MDYYETDYYIKDVLTVRATLLHFLDLLKSPEGKAKEALEIVDCSPGDEKEDFEITRGDMQTIRAALVSLNSDREFLSRVSEKLSTDYDDLIEKYNKLSAENERLKKAISPTGINDIDRCISIVERMRSREARIITKEPTHE